MLNWVCSKLNKYNPFNTSFQILDELHDTLIELREDIGQIRKEIDKDVKDIESEIGMYKHMLSAIGEAMPDMLWLKDLDGNYLYANKTIRTKLLLSPSPIGKNDVELANLAKEKYGPENHTFGQLCANSDKVVIETLREGRFLEHGKVKGEMLYLEVFKAPVFDGNNLIGICGSGRDMTEYVEAYRSNDCDTCPTMKDIFKKYEYSDRKE